MPWALAKDSDKIDRLNTVLYNLLESIRFGAIMLRPFLTKTSDKILNQLNTNVTSYESLNQFGLLEQDLKVCEKPEILFARIDEKEMLEKIEANQQEVTIKVSKKEEITIDDFNKVEMVVGKVICCVKHPSADKLLVSQIDIGNEIRQVVSGVASSYLCEEIIDKKVIIVINLKEAKIRGVISQGMILAGTSNDQLEIVNIEKLEIGSIIK